MDVDDENTEPSESFKKEVKEYFKEQALKNSSDRTTRQITHGKDRGWSRGVDWVSSHPPMGYIVDVND